MASVALVVGGCRSGKSTYAQAWAESLPGARLYLATSPVTDDEMHERILAHQLARQQRDWRTVEEQLDLAAVLRCHKEYEVVLVECVTLWVNNLLYRAEQEEREVGEADVALCCEEVLVAAAARTGVVVFVTNEVGLGLVPDNALARRYRDLVGRVNQMIAARAERVTLVSCGIPLALKGYGTHE